MRSVIFGLLSILSLAHPSLASHPQLLLDSEELRFMRSKVARNSADWQRLKENCDNLTTYAVMWPDSISGGNSLQRGYVVGSAHSPGFIHTGYNGGGFDKAIMQLGVCYQAVKTIDPKQADKYLRQAHNVITVIAQRPIVLTRKTDGAIRYAASVDIRGRDLRAGSRLSVLLPHPDVLRDGDSTNNLSVGQMWTISDATGCTSMNGLWRISAIEKDVISFANPDGSLAPVLNADCSLYTFDPMRSGYPLRFWIPALAKAYDWFYDGLSEKEKEDLLFCMNAWLYELAATELHAHHPEDNFVFGNFWALVAAYVATDGDNSESTSFYTRRIAEQFTEPNRIRDYWNRWMSGGGFGEGWQAYGFNATRWMMNALLAMKLHGIDWSQPPYNFHFVDDTLGYWMEFTTPSKLALDDNEYVNPISSIDKGITEPVWIPLSHAVMFTAVGRAFHSPLSAQFQSWYQEAYEKERVEAGKKIPEWSSGVYTSQPDAADEFLYHDAEADSADWRKLPLMYRAWSGDYAVSRSDWTDDAVEVTLLGGPTVAAAGNGKTQFDSGSITIQRGNDRLLVYGLGEAARSGDIITPADANHLHQERGTYGNKKNSIFWAGAGEAETRNQGLTSRLPPPGQSSDVTSWDSSIDRAEDTTQYTYWRANGLEANNARSVIDGKYHQTSWTREVFFYRPRLVIVHDRTTVLNSGDDRALFWTFGRNLTQTSSTSGTVQFDTSFKGTYRGRFSSVLPAAASISIVDHDNMHFLYRAEVRPAKMDHTNDDWLAVFDAAASPQKTTSFEALQCINADAIQLNDSAHTVIAFAQSIPPPPIRIPFGQSAEFYLADLAPNTNYSVIRDALSLTITPDNGTNRMMTSQSGVLHVPQ